MAEPHVMASTFWGATVSACEAPTPTLLSATPGNGEVTLEWSDEHTENVGVTGYRVYYDQSGKAQLVDEVGLTTSYLDTNLNNGDEYCYKTATLYDADGDGLVDCESGFSTILCAIPNNQGQAKIGVSSLETGLYTGKGKNQTFSPTDTFTGGDEVIFRALVFDASTGLPVANAAVTLAVSGPESLTLTTDPSDGDGIAEAAWKTSKSNKGQGGTAPGTYTVEVAAVSASGYTWDGVSTNATFTLR